MGLTSLKALEQKVLQELAFTDYFLDSWVIPPRAHVHQVVIIGAGMAGLAAAFALRQANISQFKLFDAYPQGAEGPWSHYARMKILRSPKQLTGPAHRFPSLTFRAWYEAQWGEKAWTELGKIPTSVWMDYLRWFRKVLQFPIQNNTKLLKIEPANNLLKLTLNHAGAIEHILTKKLVLATGREGFGGARMPAFVQNLPKTYYAHTNEEICFAELAGKRVCIIGAGASAFDAAAAALENHAQEVMLILRRKHIPRVNKSASVAYYGYNEGFYSLPDEAKYLFFTKAREEGTPPPFEALDRIKACANFSIKVQSLIQQVQLKDKAIEIKTNREQFQCDYLILATGFNIDGTQQAEISPFIDQIFLWKDRISDSKYGNFPYLGPHFEFLEKYPQNAPFLKHIYCFNYAATLSHGLISSDIPGIGVGAQRLANGIATDLFTENWTDYFNQFQEFRKPEFDEKNYPWLVEN